MADKESSRVFKAQTSDVVDLGIRERDTGFIDPHGSTFSPPGLVSPIESPMFVQKDPMQRLIESVERLEKKMDSKWESMEQKILKFQAENIDERTRFETEVTRTINNMNYDNTEKIERISQNVKTVTDKLASDIVNCNDKIETCENIMRTEQVGTYEVLKGKIIENQRMNHEQITELTHKHECLKLGIEGDLRRLRQQRGGQPGIVDNQGLITKQLKLPTYAGKPWEKPINYVRELEEYFQLLNVGDELGLKLIGQCLTNEAKDWWIARRDIINTWEEFKQRFLSRYWGDETQRNIRRDLEFGYYVPDSKVSWSEYTSKKFAAACGITPVIPECEIVGNLIRHFDESIVEAAKCRCIRDIDTLLSFLDQMQSGGRSNAPKPGNQTQTQNRFNTQNRHVEDKAKQTSWRHNNTGVPKPNLARDDNNTTDPQDNKVKPSSHEPTKRSNWTNTRGVNAVIEENEVEKSEVKETESENREAL
jgi:hypothetical protein